METVRGGGGQGKIVSRETTRERSAYIEFRGGVKTRPTNGSGRGDTEREGSKQREQGKNHGVGPKEINPPQKENGRRRTSRGFVLHHTKKQNIP